MSGVVRCHAGGVNRVVPERQDGPSSVVLPVVHVVDIAAKLVLLALLALVVVDPGWGNLEGKAPMARALTYPLLAFAIPLWWHVRARPTPYPWVADLLLTITGFSDILGNRLDLYDRIVWFDDVMHFLNIGLVAAAVILLTLDRSARFVVVLERAIAVGMTAGLAWEVFEYFSFVTRHSELRWAYADTVGDLALGWLGAAAAALVVDLARNAHRPGRHLWHRHLRPQELFTSLRP